MRPPLSHIQRNRRLKVEYLESRQPPEPEPESPEPEAPMEEIVVDLDALEDPYDLRAGIVPAPRWDNRLDPEIEREAVRRMNEMEEERTQKIQRLRKSGERAGPRLPGQYFSTTSSGVTIENPEANRRAWARRGRPNWGDVPYSEPGENFEQAARRHLGIQRSAELIEMQQRTREEIGAGPEEIPDPFKGRDEPRDARAKQPETWDSAGEEQSRLARVARSVGIKSKKNRSQSKQARAQKRDEHGRFAS
jgi:hypothetical protein